MLSYGLMLLCMNSQLQYAQPAPGPAAGPAVDVSRRPVERGEEVLSPKALGLLASLHRRFNARRLQLLEMRQRRQADIDRGQLPGFLPETAQIRAADWRIAPVPTDLADRRVEITGPVDRKMIVNALNAPVRTFMADFEDSCSPTWDNLIHGQINLADRWRGALDFSDPASGKQYRLGPSPAVLAPPRSW